MEPVLVQKLLEEMRENNTIQMRGHPNQEDQWYFTHLAPKYLIARESRPPFTEEKHLQSSMLVPNKDDTSKVQGLGQKPLYKASLVPSLET